MFVDSVDIFVSSGNGGAGAISFRREKFITQGGPDGGDGGRGGDVYFDVDSNSDTLSKFRGKKHYKASNGESGQNKNKNGKKGDDICIKIPLGTQIIDFNTNEILYDFDKPNKVLFLKGGKGGLGNARFKNSINQKPTYAQLGIKGIKVHLLLELKMIADVGLVGFPNAGKSTLLSTISNARPQIANYEFTTMIPKLGVVNVDELNSFVMADMPGLINGASIGKGLGIEFLKHIERAKLFLFVLNIQKSPLLQFLDLLNEVRNFKNSLENRPFAIVITQVDTNMQYQFALDELKFYFESKNIENSPSFILPISSISGFNIDKLKFLLSDACK